MTELWIRTAYPEYHVSWFGRVARMVNGGLRPLKPSQNSEGYMVLNVTHVKPRKQARVHLLVAAAFLPPKPTPRHEINHKDGDKTNNRADNLEWVTHSENVRHIMNLRGRRSWPGEPTTEDDIRTIRRMRSEGISRSMVASMFRMSPSNVTMITERKTWAHVQ